MDRKFANDLDEASERVLKMTEQLLSLVETGQSDLKGKGKAKPTAKPVKPAAKTAAKTRRKLEDEDDVVDGYKRGVIGVVDGLLEDAVSALEFIRYEQLAERNAGFLSRRAQWSEEKGSHQDHSRQARRCWQQGE